MVREEVVHTIELFLLNRGFDAEKQQEGVEDGHWMLATMPLLLDACCPVAFEAALRGALERLEEGQHWEGERLVMSESDWTPEDTKVVLRQAGLSLQPKRASK